MMLKQQTISNIILDIASLQAIHFHCHSVLFCHIYIKKLAHLSTGNSNSQHHNISR